MTERVLVISPVRNEAAHVDAVVDAVAEQGCRPDLWLVVDDGSTDGTAALVELRAAELGFLRLLQTQGQESGPDRLAEAAEARAFNWALSTVDLRHFDFIGKLDGDMVLDPRHFERLLEEFRADPLLGIAGCFYENATADGWQLAPMPDYHVNGALKLYRRECFEQIGGVHERLGWDTIDETYARMGGWNTRSVRDVRARHLRPAGSAGGLLRGKARHGECVWIVHYPTGLVLARGLRMLAAPPRLAGGLAFLFGYVRAAVRRRPRVADPAFRRFSRREQRRRMRRETGRLLRRVRHR